MFHAVCNLELVIEGMSEDGVRVVHCFFKPTMTNPSQNLKSQLEHLLSLDNAGKVVAAKLKTPWLSGQLRC